MSPEDCSEGARAVGHHYVGGHAPALGAGIGDVVDSHAAAMFDTRFLDVERSVGIVVEGMILRAQGSGHEEKQSGEYEAHRLSLSDRDRLTG